MCVYSSINMLSFSLGTNNIRLQWSQDMTSNKVIEQEMNSDKARQVRIILEIILAFLSS